MGEKFKDVTESVRNEEHFKSFLQLKSELMSDLTDYLVFLKRETFKKRKEIQALEERIAVFASVDFDPTISNKVSEQRRVLNQIDIAQLDTNKEELEDIFAEIAIFEKELNEFKSS